MEYQELSPQKIGESIVKLRNNRNLTQEEFGKEIGISASAVTMYETGRRVPRDEIKVKIANFFGVPIERIFYQKKLHDT